MAPASTGNELFKPFSKRDPAADFLKLMDQRKMEFTVTI